MREIINIVSLFFFTVLVFAACTKPDRDDEAVALSKEIVNGGLSDVDYSVERVDSAEQAGLFTAVHANTIKAIIYSNADRRRLAAYYVEKAIAAEAGYAVTTSADSNLYCKAAILDMRGAKFFIDDFTGGFVPYFERCIDNLLEFNSNNMALIGVTREELMEFVKAEEKKT